MELHELYQQLEKYKDFESNTDHIEPFLDTVDQIVLKQDPSSIPIILELFDDNSKFSWAMESIKCAIEHYPIVPYITELLKKLPYILSKCPEWTVELFNAILNTPEDIEYFKKYIIFAERNDLIKLFDLIKLNYPHQEIRIREIMH